MKKQFLSLLCISALLLNGCANNGLTKNIENMNNKLFDTIDGWLMQKALKDNESSYQEYLNADAETRMNAKKYADEIEKDEKTGLTLNLAQNEGYIINYYSDEKCENSLEEPGDKIIRLNGLKTIYAKISTAPICWQIKGFWMYDTTKKSTPLQSTPNEDNTVYKIIIPENIELIDNNPILIPIGERIRPKLTFKVESLDSTVNPPVTVRVGDQYIPPDDNQYEILLDETEYTVSAEYDSNQWQFHSFNGDTNYELKKNEDDQTKEFVEFSVDTNAKIPTYTLELKKKYYYSITLSDADHQELYVDGKPITPISEDGAWHNNAIKGTTIEVRSKDKLDASAIKSNNLIPDTEHCNDYCLQYKVGTGDGKISFDPITNGNPVGGTIEFYFDEKHTNKIEAEIELKTGTTIYYKATANSGYKCETENGSFKMSANYIGDLPTIGEIENIQLPQPKIKVGKIVYQLDGKEITEDKVNFCQGIDKLTAKCIPDEYYCAKDMASEVDCEISKNNKELSFITQNGNCSVDEIFEIQDRFLPNLKVTLDNNVGKNVQFQIKQKDTQLNEQESIQKQKGDNHKLIDKQLTSISPLTIGNINQDLLTNEAYKVKVTKKLKEGKTQHEIGFMSNTHLENAPLTYTVEFPMVEADYYTDIEITIEKVNVKQFSECYYNKLANAEIKFYYADSGKEVKPNDVMDDSCEITIRVTPKQGYVLTEQEKGNKIGKEVKSPYKKTCDFEDITKVTKEIQSKYVSTKESMLNQ